MWLCTQFGFYSIVQKRPGEYHVRARLKQDLVNLKDLCAMKWTLHRSAPPADYRWRLVVTERDIGQILECLSAPVNLEYSNFKSRISTSPDQRDKSHAYGQLWSNLHALQT